MPIAPVCALGNPLSLVDLVPLLRKTLKDESSVTCKMACSAVRVRFSFLSLLFFICVCACLWVWLYCFVCLCFSIASWRCATVPWVSSACSWWLTFLLWGILPIGSFGLSSWKHWLNWTSGRILLYLADACLIQSLETLNVSLPKTAY